MFGYEDATNKVYTPTSSNIIDVIDPNDGSLSAQYDVGTDGVDVVHIATGSDESAVTFYTYEAGSTQSIHKYTTTESLSSTVSGTVTDSSGNQISQADIQITDTSDGSTVFSGTTDASGQWSTELSDGDYEVTAKKTGYEPNTKTFTVSGSSVSISQTLATDTYSVSGYILDGTGNPVDGATITVSNNTDTVTTATAGSNGYYSTNLANGSYSLEASSSGYKNGSITATVDGASLSDQNITLGQDTISGVVRTTDGAPVKGATVKVLAVNFTALDVPDPRENEERADELLSQAENVTPPDWNPNANLRENVSKLNGKYVAVHSKGDWQLRGFNIKELDSAPTIGADPHLSTMRTELPADQTLVFSIWDASEGGLLEDNADEDLPGETASGTVVIERLGPGGEQIDDQLRLNTSGTVKIRSVGSPTGKTHETAATELQPGFYRIYPADNPAAAQVRAIGDPESITQGWRQNLTTRAGDLTEQAKQIRQRIENHTFEPITTTTDANGEWSVTANTHLDKASIIAYKVPAELGKDPRDATMEDMRNLFESGTYNGSYVLPADAERVDVPKSNVEVRVVGANAPDYADLRQYATLAEWFNAFMANHSYAEAIPVLQQRLTETADAQAEELYRQWLSLSKQNQELREKAKNNNGGQTIIRETETIRGKINGTNVSEMQDELEALRQSLSELQGTIDNGTLDSSVNGGNVSLSFPFETDLTTDQVAVLVHYSNGTTQTLSPTNSSYVSVKSNMLGGDTVRIKDYPINRSGVAVANFDVTVANAEGIGRASKRITNPNFDGDVPKLAGIDLSTLRPGPDEVVRLTVHPAETADVKRLESVRVFDPAGGEIVANTTGGRTAQFTTNGSGTYHIEAVYSNLDGYNFSTTFQVVAGQQDQNMPASMRVVESTIGTYALTGESLDAGAVEIENGGSDVTVFARIPNASDPPGRLHVYTHAVTLPPDSSLDVHVVRGAERRAVQQTVGVTIHTASLPDDAYVYRMGSQPLPAESQTRFGSVTEQGGHTVIQTYTDENGHVSVNTNANPGWLDRVQWLWRTYVPEVSLPFTLHSPLSAGIAPFAAVGVTVAAYRRRRR